MRLRRRAILLLAGCFALAPGCGDDEPGKAGPSATKPSGKPLVVGVTYVASGPEQQTEVRDGAEATVRHINERLGGIRKRPVELEFCEMDGSPEGSARCANELVRKQPIAVVAGQDLGSNASLPIYEKAKVAYISHSARTDQMNVNPAAVALGGSFPLTGAAFAKFLGETLGAKSINFLYPDFVPAEPLNAFFVAPAAKLGAAIKLIPYSASAPDMTAPVAAAAESDPDAIFMALFDDNRCVQGMRAAQQVGTDAKVLQLECNEDEVLEQAGSAAEGQYFYAATDVGAGGPETPDVKTYYRYMEEFAPGVDPAGDARWAAMPLMTLRGVVEKLGGDPTGPAVLKAFKSTSGHVFLADDYRCGQVKAFPSLCADKFRFAQFKDGERVSVTDWISGVDLLR